MRLILLLLFLLFVLPAPPTAAQGETPPPVPTRTLSLPQVNSSGTQLLTLPNTAIDLDLAVHPTDNWPAVAVVDVPLVIAGEPRVFVRALDPAVARWNVGQSVDTTTTRIGKNHRSVAAAVHGDRGVSVLWGVSAFPQQALFAAHSTDAGRTFGPPETVLTDAFRVLDAVGTADGHLFVLATKRMSDPTSTPEVVGAVLLHRLPSGTWQPPETVLAEGLWYGSEGAMVLTDGTSAFPARRVVAVFSSLGETDTPLITAAKNLDGSTSWLIGTLSIPGAGLVRAIHSAKAPVLLGVNYPPTFVQSPPIESELLLFGIQRDATATEPASAYALVGLYSGDIWSLPTRVAAVANSPNSGIGGVAPLIDPLTLAANLIFPCCAAPYGGQAATHYAAVGAVGFGWQPSADVGGWNAERALINNRLPIISGARGAWLTVSAQAANSRVAWLAWVDDRNEVWARTLSPLNAPLEVQP